MEMAQEYGVRTRESSKAPYLFVFLSMPNSGDLGWLLLLSRSDFLASRNILIHLLFFFVFNNAGSLQVRRFFSPVQINRGALSGPHNYKDSIELLLHGPQFPEHCL